MHFTITIPQGLPEMTVKELLEEQFLIPRKIRHFLRIKKHVFVNQKPINWQSIVHPHDKITLIFDEEDYPEKSILMGKANLVEELYQDEHIIIVNKPEGMKTHANEPTELALLNHVSAYVGSTCYVVHRLDKETSGAVLFAKNPFILPILNRLLENKEISREYWALVQGTFPKNIKSIRIKSGAIVMIAENVWWITRTVNTLKHRSPSSKRLETIPSSSASLKLDELIKFGYI